MQFEQDRGLWKYFLLSIGCHGVLALIFSFIVLKTSPEKLDLVEIDFIQKSQIIAASPAEEVTEDEDNQVKSNNKKILPPSSINISESKKPEIFPKGKKIQAISKNEFDPSVKPIKKKPITKEIDNSVISKSSPMEKLPDEISSNISPGAERNFDEDITNFKLKGEISQRKLRYSPVLGSSDVSVNAVLELSFDVLPDGKVLNVKTLKKAGSSKSETEIEHRTIELVKQWLFEPLPQSMEKRETQIGSVTFIYKLK